MTDQTEFLNILRARTGVVKDGEIHLPGSSFVKLESDDKATFSDPLSQKIESDDAQMRHRFVISTPAVDRAGDVVMPHGCEKYLERYQKNPQVFLNHASYGLPIAKSVSPSGKLGVEVSDDRLVADAFFHGKTYESEKTYELIKLGYLGAASIGFKPIKATLMPKKKRPEDEDEIDFQFFPGLKFLEWELMEWSVVGVPCNPEALDGMKSWVGKNANSDSQFHMALKAMLAGDKGKSVMVSVPAAPPKAKKVTEPKTSAAFTTQEVEKAIQTAIKTLTIEVKDLTPETPAAVSPATETVKTEPPVTAGMVTIDEVRKIFAEHKTELEATQAKHDAELAELKALILSLKSEPKPELKPEPKSETKAVPAVEVRQWDPAVISEIQKTLTEIKAGKEKQADQIYRLTGKRA